VLSLSLSLDTCMKLPVPFLTSPTSASPEKGKNLNTKEKIASVASCNCRGRSLIKLSWFLWF
jgi:hypothetical protein